MDPYDENDVKGTRIPDYAKVAKDRDVYGELGWIGNFNVKDAKNNDHRHHTYREYFDKPKNYHQTYTNSTLTNSEFFRQNAPQNSVAHNRNSNSSTGFESWKPGSRMHSMSGSTYATPFVLDHDRTNIYKVNDKLVGTMMPEQSHMVPFLRDHDATLERAKAENDGRSMERKVGRNTTSRKKLVRREISWNNYAKPISSYNASVHPS